MEIVIDMDDGMFQDIVDGKGDVPSRIVRSFQATIADAIKNGTPLPEHHGRLISEEDMLSVIMFSKLFDDAKVGEVKEALLNIPTIITGE